MLSPASLRKLARSALAMAALCLMLLPASAEEDEPGEAPNVAGSYAQSCRNCTGETPGLVCECRRIDQSYRRTAIDPDVCAGGEIENLDGRLACTHGLASTPRPAPASPQAADEPPLNSWISVAAGIEPSSSGAAVSAAFSRGRTAGEARRKATEACERDGSVSVCRAIGAWNRGCAYVTTSTAGIDGGAVAWGSGSSALAAYNNCLNQSGVYQCRTKGVGGCVD